ncbi:hypothetical protein ACFTY7_02605 [Streptomyces sp. NPDC057062]|uniref:hypothetical protein n=1 Tax=Streptomyces sp. NPDC057062 TaxID=3346011 RepID=UPI00363B23BD
MYSISRLERVCGPREQACDPGRPPPRNPAACHDAVELFRVFRPLADGEQGTAAARAGSGGGGSRVVHFR